jgi:hypothetical protein
MRILGLAKANPFHRRSLSRVPPRLGGKRPRRHAAAASFGLTDWTRNGSLAEYVAVEARNLAPLPADVDHTVAAAGECDRLAAVARTAGSRRGHRVARYPGHGGHTAGRQGRQDGVGEAGLHRVRRISPYDRLLPLVADAHLGGGQEAGTEVDALGPQGEGRGQPTAVGDAARRDDRDGADQVHHRGDDHHGADGPAVAAGLTALSDDEQVAQGCPQHPPILGRRERRPPGR